MQALARANEVRLARAALKRDVSAGRRDIAAVIMDSPWEVESMSLSELLSDTRALREKLERFKSAEGAGTPQETAAAS